MALTGDVTVIELDGPSLTAVWARVSDDAVVVKRWISARRPAEVVGDRADLVGAWVGKTLRDADVPRRRVVMAVSRGDVILKQLAVPGGESSAVDGGLPEADLASIVRLQMSRQITVGPAGSAIDYVRMDPRVPGIDAGGTGGSVIRVMAAAMPADRVAWAKSVAEAGGLTLRRIGVESYGVAALLAELSMRRDGAVLGVAIGPQSTEFVIVEDGEMAFARAVGAESPAPKDAESETALADGVEQFAERMAVEARRTLNSFRSQRGADAATVAVLGQGTLAARVAEKCATAVGGAGVGGGGVSHELVPLPGYVTVPADLPDAARCAIAPLVGLLIEGVVGRPTLDFANPRKLPDPHARARQVALAGVLGLIVLAGAGYVAGDRQLGALERQVKALRASESVLRSERDRLLADHARVMHFERWAGRDVGKGKGERLDWVGLTGDIVDQLPEASRGALDELSARADVETTFVPGSSTGGGYPLGTWGTRVDGRVEMSGQVDGRQVAEDLRERLLRSGLYEVENRGPDVDNRYTLTLRVSRVGAAASGGKP